MDVTGRWVGETQAVRSALHYWLILQDGKMLTIYTRWEYEPHLSLFASGVAVEGDTFLLKTGQDTVKVEVKYQDHFVIPNWVYGEKDGQLIPAHTVSFKRRDKGIKAVLMASLIAFLRFWERSIRLFGLERIFASPILLLK